MDNMNGIKTNWTSYVSMKIKGSEIKRVINAKLQIGKRHKKTEEEEEEEEEETVTKISTHATSIKNDTVM